MWDQSPTVLAFHVCGSTWVLPWVTAPKAAWLPAAHVPRVRQPGGAWPLSFFATAFWEGEAHLVPPLGVSTGPTQPICWPVPLWTRSPLRGQEAFPTSASATSLVTCGHRHQKPEREFLKRLTDMSLKSQCWVWGKVLGGSHPCFLETDLGRLTVTGD